jgi:hypothetical protein
LHSSKSIFTIADIGSFLLRSDRQARDFLAIGRAACGW